MKHIYVQDLDHNLLIIIVCVNDFVNSKHQVKYQAKEKESDQVEFGYNHFAVSVGFRHFLKNTGNIQYFHKMFVKKIKHGIKRKEPY